MPRGGELSNGGHYGTTKGEELKTHHSSKIMGATKNKGPQVKATCHWCSVVYIYWLAAFVLNYVARPLLGLLLWET